MVARDEVALAKYRREYDEGRFNSVTAFVRAEQSASSLDQGLTGAPARLRRYKTGATCPASGDLVLEAVPCGRPSVPLLPSSPCAG